MTAQENEAVVRRMIEEVWSDHDFANFEDLVADDHVEHMLLSEHRHGIAGERYAMEWVLSVFPDHRFEIEDVVASGDRVAVRGTCSGTHEGELLGIPPTGQRLSIKSNSVERVSDGKIREHWRITDTLDMMQQLGVIPMPEHA